jgi:phage host-nuclease inhibitor protein Gam
MKKTKSIITIPDVETLGALVSEAIRLGAEVEAEDLSFAAEWQKAKATHAETTRASRERHAALVKAITRHVAGNRTTLMGDAKHIDLPQGVRVGYRLAPWSVERLDDTDTWEEIAHDVSEMPEMDSFVKTTITLNKAAILAAKDNITHQQMTAMGLVFSQAENLYMEVVS